MYPPAWNPANPVKVPECKDGSANQQEDSGKGDDFPPKASLWLTRRRFLIPRGNRGNSRCYWWRCSNHSNRPNKAVALADNGLQKTRLIWVVAQCQPNFANCGV